MKKLTAFFGVTVAGIVLCLVMTIYTGVMEARERDTPRPLTIPLPAMNQ